MKFPSYVTLFRSGSKHSSYGSKARSKIAQFAQDLKCLVRQHVNRAHGEEANDIQVVTFGNLSSQDVSRPQIETLTRPPSETEPPQPLVDVDYARGSEDSLSKNYAQPRNTFDVTSFGNLAYVFGSWGL